MRYVRVNQQIVDIAATGSFTRDKWNELTTVFGIVSECCHRSHISAVAFLVPPAQAMAKRSHQSTDDARKLTGESSKSIPVGSRILAWQCDMKHIAVQLGSCTDAVRCQGPGGSKLGRWYLGVLSEPSLERATQRRRNEMR